jgi:iron complex transport system permease protein
MSGLSRTIIGASVITLLALGLISLTVGKVYIPLSVWLDPGQDPRWLIVMELRLPRAILGALVGAALGLSGAAAQGYTRNPLADPGVLGVSSIAALGAVCALYFGLGFQQPFAVPLMAVLGAVCGVALLLGLSGASESVVTFVLAGVILNIVGGAAVALALSLAPDPFAAQEIINWLMGALVDRSRNDVIFALPLIALGAVFLFSLVPALDALTLGEDGARSMGIDLRRTRIALVLGIGLTTGAAVAVSGVIGFVGLVIPHLMRPLVGHRPGALLLPSALGGAVLVMAADILVRVVPTGAEIKLGIALSVIGGPFFLMLLLRLRRQLT